MDIGFSCRKNAFSGEATIGTAISGPRIADTNFTDTKRIFWLLFYNRGRGGIRGGGVGVQAPRGCRKEGGGELNTCLGGPRLPPRKFALCRGDILDWSQSVEWDLAKNSQAYVPACCSPGRFRARMIKHPPAQFQWIVLSTSDGVEGHQHSLTFKVIIKCEKRTSQPASVGAQAPKTQQLREKKGT